jgi:hypothetical protein
MLRDNGVAPTVIDLNLNAIRTLREEGWRRLGDANVRNPRAQAATAGSLISAPQVANSASDSGGAKTNPHVRVLGTFA